MRLSKDLNKLLMLSLVVISASCLTGRGSIKAPANLAMSISDENFNPISPIGSKTLSLDTSQIAMWLTFEQPGSPTGYALIIQPNLFEGVDQEFKIQPKPGIESNDKQTTTIGSSYYNAYFDLVLRGHRGLLNGNLKKVRSSIKKLDEKYSTTYGGLTLALLLQISEKNTPSMLKTLEEIKRVFPRSVLLRSLEDDQTTGATQ